VSQNAKSVTESDSKSVTIDFIYY